MHGLSAPMIDPFGRTADPARYVPRDASERALEALERGIERSPHAVLLEGPAGMGKTLLLRILAEQLGARWRPTYLPYPRLDVASLCRWVLDDIGLESGADPIATFMALAEELAREGQAGLALLIDDAQHLPDETLAWLVTQLDRQSGALAIAATLSSESGEDAAAGFVADQGSPDEGVASDEAAEEEEGEPEPDRFEIFSRVVYDEPLSPDEAKEYMHSCLSIENLDERTVLACEARSEELNAAARGVPGALNEVASDWLRALRADPNAAPRIETGSEPELESAGDEPTPAAPRPPAALARSVA